MSNVLRWLPLLLLLSCGTRPSGDLCERYFEPYPDLISARQTTRVHQIYVNGMELYARGEFRQAADSLEAYLRIPGYEKSAHFYLAISLLALDQPYEAELHIDHVENSNITGFRDQSEWYTLLSWVCSGQYQRALPEAQRIASRRHTYREEAARLARDLTGKMDA
jgi:hypothetical protein